MNSPTVRRISTATVAFVIWFGVVGAASAHTAVAIDRFIVTRANKLLFQDTFTGKMPPPAAPAFANGQAGSYVVNGTIKPGNLARGKLTLESADGVFGRLPDGSGRRNLFARLLTNTGPANPGGLKAGVPFATSGRFDLVMPGGPIEGYGIRFSDAGPSGPAHLVQVFVLRNPNDRTVVRLQEFNFATGLQNNIADVPIEVGEGQQILLTLTRPTVTDSHVDARYQIVAKGVLSGPPVMVGTVPKLFDGNTWTRSEFFVFEAADTP